MSDLHAGCSSCSIVRKETAAYLVHEDGLCIAFLDRRGVRPGHTMVIPRRHINQFVDLDDALAAHLLRVGQRIARKIKAVLQPPRVGYVVAGFGVAHAHLHVQPLWETHDITSQRYLDPARPAPVFDAQNLPLQTEAEQLETLGRIRLAPEDH